jgi:hypothetical protein
MTEKQSYGCHSDPQVVQNIQLVAIPHLLLFCDLGQQRGDPRLGIHFILTAAATATAVTVIQLPILPPRDATAVYRGGGRTHSRVVAFACCAPAPALGLAGLLLAFALAFAAQTRHWHYTRIAGAGAGIQRSTNVHESTKKREELKHIEIADML